MDIYYKLSWLSGYEYPFKKCHPWIKTVTKIDAREGDDFPLRFCTFLFGFYWIISFALC
jgi:hypothetical protein